MASRLASLPAASAGVTPHVERRVAGRHVLERFAEARSRRIWKPCRIRRLKLTNCFRGLECRLSLNFRFPLHRRRLSLIKKSCHDFLVKTLSHKKMKNLTREEEASASKSRQSRRSAFVAIATVLALHPVNLPLVKLDFHVTFDTHPYPEGSVRSPQMERN
jgi:hypothetical protein